jgi:hypothetical protein
MTEDQYKRIKQLTDFRTARFITASELLEYHELVDIMLTEMDKNNESNKNKTKY